MKLISWNVNGIRACLNKGFENFFKQMQDVLKKLLIKETYPTYTAPTLSLTADTMLVEYDDVKNITFNHNFVQNDAGNVLGKHIKYGMVNDTMTEIQKMQAGELSKVFGNDMSKGMETLTTYNSELIAQLEDMEDLVESIEQGLLDTMDEVKEKMEAQVEAYEYVNILLESDMELVQMLYGEDWKMG